MLKDVGMAVPKSREARAVYMPQDKRLSHATIEKRKRGKKRDEPFYLLRLMGVSSTYRVYDNAPLQ